jgi:very-short-patch-repair endonuclease
VKNFLEENNTVVFQAKFEWCKAKKHLPFDFLIQKFKIIIEVDGLQHFKQVMNWQSPEETLKIDKLKSSLALKNGYSVIRISQDDVFKNTLDWQKILTECIKEYVSPVCIFISKDPQLYNTHKNSV